jgi:hypothetical protein
MKILKYILLICLFFQPLVFANYNDVFIADIQYDWINKTELEKDEIINEVKDIVFENDISKIKGFRSQFKNFIQDKDYRNHYLAASAGLKEYNGYNISAFYYKKQKHIYMYAIQDKKDLTKAYYYDALGNLRYVDFNLGDYPEYPYTTIQYKVSGEPISVIYYISKDSQYLYEPNGTFKGVWYKTNLYDRDSKVILTRSSY